MTLPLLDRPADAVLFRRQGEAIGANRFLCDAHRLASRLPPGRNVANLCRDRYGFAVAFAAALIAGRTSLLNVEGEDLARLHPGCPVLTDDPALRHPAPTLLVVPDGTADWTGPMPQIPERHVAAVVFTSGSTGQPIGHPKCWASLVARAKAGGERFGVAGGTLLGLVPPQHMYGFETTILLPMQSPASSWAGPAFFPGDVAAALPHAGDPCLLVGTPLQLRTLLQAGVVLGGLHTCISATAPLDPALAAECEQAWNAPVLEIFGATECGSIASRRTTATQVWEPYPGITLDMDAAGATVHAPHEPPVPLADVLEAAPGGFRLIGRRADVVKLAGRRASLPGLNHVLTGLPGVSDGAFVVPDDSGAGAAERLVAVVVAPDRSGAAILADLRERLDPAFVPRRVVLVDALPRNAMGKLPRQALLRLVSQP